MATPVAWLLNLDADSELADAGRYREDVRLTARIAELVPRMELLLRPSDVLLHLDAAAHGCMPVLAFSPTPSALARIAKLGLRAHVEVPLSVLREVNSRAFCAQLGQTMEHATYVHDMRELEQAIAAPSEAGSFVLKRPFSFAGRERRQARAGQLDASTRGFAQRTFAQAEGLQVEPWVERLADFARHGWVSASGGLLLGPAVRQICNRAGVWERSVLADPGDLSHEEQTSLEAELCNVGAALARKGYRGPYGIDAFRYRGHEDETRFQPRCEINARFTMGYPRALLERALAAE